MARIYQPRRRQSDKRWDYTISSDEEGWAYAAGYCHEYRPLSYSDCGVLAGGVDKYNAKMEPFKDKFHAGGHATSEEAQECYRQYQLDHELEFFNKPQEEADRLNRCVVCREFTAGLATLGNFQHWPLCATHQTREAVAELMEKDA
jgi:hypothetical protein